MQHALGKWVQIFAEKLQSKESLGKHKGRLKDFTKIDLRKIGLQIGDGNHVTKHRPKFSGGVFNLVTNWLFPRKSGNSLIACINVISSCKALCRRFSPRLRLVHASYGPYTRSYMNTKLFHGGTKCRLLFILGRKLKFAPKPSPKMPNYLIRK
jgi:hypothetical protein